MSAPPKESSSAILIVDDDFGFIVWLGHTLAASGYITVPATSTQAAKQLIDELRIAICLVIVNLEVPGTADLVDTLQRRDPSVKTIAIGVTGPGTAPSINIDAAHSRSQSDWLATVRQVLDNDKLSGAA